MEQRYMIGRFGVRIGLKNYEPDGKAYTAKDLGFSDATDDQSRLRGYLDRRDIIAVTEVEVARDTIAAKEEAVTVLASEKVTPLVAPPPPPTQPATETAPVSEPKPETQPEAQETSNGSKKRTKGSE